MDEKSKEITAIAASVAGHCQPCLKHHLEKARLLGVPEEDIQGAINLAKIISEKGDERMLEFAESLLHEKERAQIEFAGQGKKKGA
ncbi:MAG: carboxymuconolactone decarboxylase family protein [Methanomassiliicoccales archaeon]|nr:carboxymuconolactone decarboxylase family protein [Methanomassiliicoccales archaeon]